MSENKENEKDKQSFDDHPLLKNQKEVKSGKKEIEVPEGASGFVKVEFTRNWGGTKKGEEKVYHVSTAKSLLHHEAIKIVEHIKKYVPEKAKK